MDLLTALVNRPYFLGKVPTYSNLAPATIVPEGCTVYVTDEAKLYMALNNAWVIMPSDTSYAGTYATIDDFPDASEYLDGSYAIANDTNLIYYVIGGSWTRLPSDTSYAGSYSTSLDLPDASGYAEGTFARVESTNQIYYVIGGAWVSVLGSILTMDTIPLSTYYSDPYGSYFLTVEKKREDATLYYETRLYYYPSTLIYDTVGRIKITIDTLTNTITSTEFVEIDDSTAAIRDLTISREEDGANHILTILLGVDENTAATAIIGGTTANGHIDMVIDGELGEEGNSYTYKVDDTSTAIRALSVTLTDYALVVNLKVVEDTAATAIIGGATVNGHVDMIIDGGLGTGGNIYAITVNADDTAIRAFSVDMIDESITVYLKVVEDTAATAIIGGATVNGHVDMIIDGGLGAAGNNYAITVDDTQSVVRDFSVVKDGTDITVNLKIVGDAKAVGVLGSGVNSHIDFEAANPGYLYNGDVVQTDVSLAAIRPMSVEEFIGNPGVTVNILTINLAVEEKTAASGVLGNPDNANGHIDVVINGGLGAGGNAYTFVVTIADGLDQPLNVTQNGTVLNIELGTDAAGFVSLTKNTCTLVAAAINGLASGDFTATADGTGVEPLTYEQPSTNFSGGANQLKPSENTCALIETEVNSVATLFVATADGDGSGSLTSPWEEDELSGGTNKVDDTASGDNSAGNIATVINALPDSPVVATADGDGSVAITTGEAEQNFAGGANKVDDTASGDNSAGNIATEINLLPDSPVIATADGDGTVALTGAEAEQSFAGGTNKVDNTASGDNSAGNIADEINALIDSAIIATADGTGTVAITSGEAEDNFAGGLNEISNTKNTTDLIIAGIEAVLVGGLQYYSCEEITDGKILTAMSNEFGFDGEFYRRIEKYYDTDGITELLSNSYLFQYDSNGNLVSEVLE